MPKGNEAKPTSLTFSQLHICAGAEWQPDTQTKKQIEIEKQADKIWGITAPRASDVPTLPVHVQSRPVDRP